MLVTWNISELSEIQHNHSISTTLNLTSQCCPQLVQNKCHHLARTHVNFLIITHLKFDWIWILHDQIFISAKT